jgi:peptidase E
MIKLILHGGGNLIGSSLKAIISEIKKDLPKDRSTKILIIPFARAEEEWKDVFDKYCGRYAGISVKKIFESASPDLKKLRDQINVSDIIFFPGGSEILLKKYLKNIKFSLFKNKTIIGVSAGANIFSNIYYSNDRRAIESGLYKLPIQTICHFDASKNDKLNKLILAGKKLKKITLAISEGEFFVLFY